MTSLKEFGGQMDLYPCGCIVVPESCVPCPEHADESDDERYARALECESDAAWAEEQRAKDVREP